MIHFFIVLKKENTYGVKFVSPKEYQRQMLLRNWPFDIQGRGWDFSARQVIFFYLFAQKVIFYKRTLQQVFFEKIIY